MTRLARCCLHSRCLSEPTTWHLPTYPAVAIWHGTRRTSLARPYLIANQGVPFKTEHFESLVLALLSHHRRNAAHLKGGAMSLVLAFVPKGKSGRACCAAAMDSL